MLIICVLTFGMAVPFYLVDALAHRGKSYHCRHCGAKVAPNSKRDPGRPARAG
jgi:hypothetical protein